jgi:hypothetical protein
MLVLTWMYYSLGSRSLTSISCQVPPYLGDRSAALQSSATMRPAPSPPRRAPSAAIKVRDYKQMVTSLHPQRVIGSMVRKMSDGSPVVKTGRTSIRPECVRGSRQ